MTHSDLPPEVHTNATLSGHVWGLVGPGRAVYAISVAEVVRMADRAARDLQHLYTDPDEALEAMRDYLHAEVQAAITPDGDDDSPPEYQGRHRAT